MFETLSFVVVWFPAMAVSRGAVSAGGVRAVWIEGLVLIGARVAKLELRETTSVYRYL
jgi:hypothetical protein